MISKTRIMAAGLMAFWAGQAIAQDSIQIGIVTHLSGAAAGPFGIPARNGAELIMGASPGPVGTARAQYDLRKMFVFLNAFPINKPEVMINLAAGKFSAEGELTDEPTRDFLRQMLASLESWTLRLNG